MQTTLVETKSSSDVLKMKIEAHAKKNLYKECVTLMESGDLIGASKLIIKQEFKKDSTLCLLLSKCLCPTFPYTLDKSQTEEYDDEDEEDIEDEIPSDLLKLLDEAEDQSDENLDKICNEYYENQPSEITFEKESYAVNLVEMAACMGDEIARQELLIYCKRNAEYIEGNLLIFMLVEMLEKADDEAMEHVVDGIYTFKNLSMYESAYFYYLIMKEKLYSTFDEVPYYSLKESLSDRQKNEIESDVEYFFKNHLIPNKYAFLKEDYLATI
jgi:hypothetical protein